MPAMWIPKRLVELSLINTAAVSGPSFSCHCEIEYESRIEAAAREVIAGGSSIVMLTGPSASGKTTTANKLSAAINSKGKGSVVVSLDNFYKNFEDYPRLADGTKDYENVTALDVDEINKCLSDIIQYGRAEIPQFDFIAERRKDDFIHLELSGGVAVIEGIHALNPLLVEALPEDKVYKIYAGLREEYSVSGQRYIATRDIRLARRMVRDNKFRGHSLEKTLSMWNSVCEGEDKYIKVFKSGADLLLDTSFSYEICCLAPFVASLKGALDGKSQYAEMLNNLCTRFSSCTSLSDKLIPQNSMLREFIGI